MVYRSYKTSIVLMEVYGKTYSACCFFMPNSEQCLLTDMTEDHNEHAYSTWDCTCHVDQSFAATDITQTFFCRNIKVTFLTLSNRILDWWSFGKVTLTCFISSAISNIVPYLAYQNIAGVLAHITIMCCTDGNPFSLCGSPPWMSSDPIVGTQFRYANLLPYRQWHHQRRIWFSSW